MADHPRALANPSARPLTRKRPRARALALLLAGALASCGDGTGPGGTVYADDPRDAQFVTADIDNFWHAYDFFVQGRGANSFQTEYLNKASPGLRDFIQARNLTVSSLVQMVDAFPQYFAAIRANTLRLATDATVLGRIRESFAEIERLYPPSIFPPVTFLIGRFSTGGTTRESGMLIGTEFFAIDDATPLQELGAFQRANVRPLDSIPLIVAHEHAHILQARYGGLLRGASTTLLAQSLMEGGADFIAQIASGSHPNQHIHPYGLQHEAALWAEFTQVMHGTDVSQWLYNQGSSTTRPGDLGYFIGYRVAQAYYDKTADKVAALKTIIEMADAPAFLAASGYSP